MTGDGTGGSENPDPFRFSSGDNSRTEGRTDRES